MRAQRRATSKVLLRKPFKAVGFISVVVRRALSKCLENFECFRGQNILDARYFVVNRLALKCIQRHGLKRIDRIRVVVTHKSASGSDSFSVMISQDYALNALASREGRIL